MNMATTRVEFAPDNNNKSALMAKFPDCNNLHMGYSNLADKKLGLLQLLLPMLETQALSLQDKVNQCCAALPANAVDTFSITDALLGALRRRLIPIVTRPLILEMNVLKLQGQLPGNNATERFEQFIRHLKDNDYCQKVLTEYQEMARCIDVTVNQWRSHSRELIERISENWAEIVPLNPGFVAGSSRLITLKCESGDTHNHGRSVAILIFSDGGKVVYKPRSMQLDACYNDFIKAQNALKGSYGFEYFAVLDKGDYGFCQFVEQKPLINQDDAGLFYERFGALSALMYCLGATDIHFENIVAMGAQPVIVDLETLLSPQTDNSFPYSVISTDMLPMRTWVSKDKDGVDLGGVSAKDGDVADTQGFGVVNFNSDEMAWGKVTNRLSDGKNLPLFNGQVQTFDEHIDRVVLGFEQYLKFFINHKTAVFSQAQALKGLLKQPVRYVVQSTYLYIQILHASFHPDLMRNQSDRIAYIERILGRYIDSSQVDGDRVDQHRVMSELEALLDNNIPIFHSSPQDTALYSGETKISNDYFSSTGAQCYFDRIAKLDDKQLAFQRFLLALSLTQSHPDLSSRYIDSFMPGCPADVGQSLEQRCIDGAKQVAKCLSNTALLCDTEITWLGYEQTPTTWSLKELSENSYDGRAGILLFFACLGDITGQKDYQQMAEKILATVSCKFNSSDMLKQNGFAGIGGYLYVLAHLAKIWPKNALVNTQIARCLSQLASKVEQDVHNDFIAGNAGAILALLNLMDNSDFADKALEIADSAGQRLLNNAQLQHFDCSWINSEGHQMISGFSHGNSGMALALNRLFEFTDNIQYLDAARKAVHTENAYYHQDADNWRDDKSQNNCAFQSTWCHGAPGIALTRVLAKHLQSEQQKDWDLTACINALTAPPTLDNHSLCHGILGNLDILHTVALKQNDKALLSLFKEKVCEQLNLIAQDGFRSATPQNQIQPNLMTGIAGMGLMLLRTACVNKIPNVLAMSVPTT